MQRLIILALSSILLGNSALADDSSLDSSIKAQLQQMTQDRNGVIEVRLLRKFDVLLDDRLSEGDRSGEAVSTAQRQDIAGNLLAAAR